MSYEVVACYLDTDGCTDGMKRVVCVPHAKVPIVKIWDSELELACDMNVNNTLALENTRMIKTYVEIDERVRPLAMVIKHWTKRRILNDAGMPLWSVSTLIKIDAKPGDSAGGHPELIHLDLHDSQLLANPKSARSSMFAPETSSEVNRCEREAVGVCR